MGSIFRIACAAAMVASGNASAAEFDAAIGKVGYGRCHMLVCGFFIIDEAVPVGVGKDGTLFALSARYWSNEYSDKAADPYKAPPVKVGKPSKSSVGLVYCSKVRPTVFDYSDQKWQATLLRVGDERALSGASESARTFYFAACHHFVTRDPVAKEMALKLGYRFALEKGEEQYDSDSAQEPMAMLR